MKFEKTFFAKEDRYWLGKESESSRHFMGIPVSNAMVDYIEYYWLTNEQYDLFLADGVSALKFADECRRRQHDELLIMRPGRDRGIPR